MTAARDRLDAWKAVREAIGSEINGYQSYIDELGARDEAEWVTESIAAAKRAIAPLSVALPMIEEQAKQAAFDVVRLERYEQLRAENPNKRAALLADRARLWTANHPEAWEALL